MKHAEPPSLSSCSPSSPFLIGKDSRGHWVVQDRADPRRTFYQS